MKTKYRLSIAAFCGFLSAPIYYFTGLSGIREDLPNADLPENTTTKEFERHIASKIGVFPENVKVVDTQGDGRITFLLRELSCDKVLWGRLDEPRERNLELLSCLTYTVRYPDSLFKVRISFDLGQRRIAQGDQPENVLLNAVQFGFQGLGKASSLFSHSYTPLAQIEPRKKSRLILDSLPIYHRLDRLIKDGKPYKRAFSKWLDKNNATYFRLGTNVLIQIDLGNGFLMKIAKQFWNEPNPAPLLLDDSIKSTELEDTHHEHVKICKNNRVVMLFNTHNEMNLLPFILKKVANRLPALFPDHIFIGQ